MDDLKQFSRNDNELEGFLATAEEFSDDIGMAFGLEKCAKVSFLRGNGINHSVVKEKIRKDYYG